jgi:SAM-dependent methyltransferase
VSQWASGNAYEPFIGRWSRLVAPEFLAWLAVPPGARWADVGCGTGALTQAILRDAAPSSVVGVEPSDAFLAYARTNVTDPRADLVPGSAEAVPLADDSVDALVSALVLNFVPDPDAALAEAARVVRPGGVVAAYVWAYAEVMEPLRLFWDAVTETDPDAAGLDEGARFPLCRRDPLVETFGGLAEVDATLITVESSYADFDEYWTPFLGGVGPGPAYVASLDDERRATLREALRARVPVAADGTIPMRASAWAVRGRVG